METKKSVIVVLADGDSEFCKFIDYAKIPYNVYYLWNAAVDDFSNSEIYNLHMYDYEIDEKGNYYCGDYEITIKEDM